LSDGWMYAVLFGQNRKQLPDPSMAYLNYQLQHLEQGFFKHLDRACSKNKTNCIRQVNLLSSRSNIRVPSMY
jgi:hypothetical protein